MRLLSALTLLAGAYVSALPALEQRQSSTSALSTPASVGSFHYIDCHSDLVANRTLTSLKTDSANMTIELCASTCATYAYFGVEYASECYCGNTLTPGSTTTTDGRCDMACGGNAAEACGGPNGLTLYGNPALIGGSSLPVTTSCTKTSSTTVKHTTTPCTTKSSTTTKHTTTKSTKTTTSKTKSSKSCTTTTLSTSTVPSTTAYDTITTNYGGSATVTITETPTSPGATGTVIIEVPAPTVSGFAPLGCFGGGLLTGPRAINGSITLEVCASFCKGFAYFAVENGNQCSCGDSQSDTTPSNGCTTPCAGNSYEVCGGFGAQNTYKAPTVQGFTAEGCFNGGVLAGPNFYNSSDSLETCASFCQGYTYFAVENGESCSCGNEPVNTIPNSGCSYPCAGNSAEICGGFGAKNLYKSAYVGGFAPQGCFNGGVLAGPSFYNSSDSLETCASFCQGYTYFAVENGYSCSCGYQPNNLIPADHCNSACAGNPNEICGGFSAANLWEAPSW